MKAYCFYCFMRLEAFADEEMEGEGYVWMSGIKTV